MAFDTPDIGYFLNRKYAILQQQADAGTTNALSSAVAANAAAQLDRTRAQILPGQSQAEIGQTNAQAKLLGEQAKVVAPESAARIASTNAGTFGTLVDAAANYNTGVAQAQPDGTFKRPSLSSVFGPSGFQGFKFGSILPDEPPATVNGVRVRRPIY